MKKKILMLIIVILVAALSVVPVLAKPALVKGVVTAIDGDQITLESKKSGDVVVNLPEDFESGRLAIGDWVIAKGQMDGDEFMAEWVKKIGKNSADNEEKSEGKKDNSAYCDAEKKQEDHPLAAALEEKFGADPAWVMDQFCGGYSMGAIMLALKTQSISGADPDEILAKRAEGQGWGAIWKELKMIGNERDAKTPPGQLKKP